MITETTCFNSYSQLGWFANGGNTCHSADPIPRPESSSVSVSAVDHGWFAVGQWLNGWGSWLVSGGNDGSVCHHMSPYITYHTSSMVTVTWEMTLIHDDRGLLGLTWQTLPVVGNDGVSHHGSHHRSASSLDCQILYVEHPNGAALRQWACSGAASDKTWTESWKLTPKSTTSSLFFDGEWPAIYG